MCIKVIICTRLLQADDLVSCRDALNNQIEILTIAEGPSTAKAPHQEEIRGA